MTGIDKDWGNPSAEITGYLYHFRKYLSKLDIKELVNDAIKHYNHIANLESEHEAYCYIRLFNILRSKDRIKLEERIKHAVGNLMNPHMDQWTTYVPMPLNFIECDSENLFNMHING